MEVQSGTEVERPGKQPMCMQLHLTAGEAPIDSGHAGDRLVSAEAHGGSTAHLHKYASGASQGGSETDDGTIRDDREKRKLRRKQSNRESARRSRQRKQAESEALSTTVTDLQQENHNLRIANKAMAARIDDLLARLEEKPESPTNLFRPKPRNGAFSPVMPSSQMLDQDAGARLLFRNRGIVGSP